MVLGRWRLLVAAVLVACVGVVGLGGVVGADPADTGDPVVLFVSSDSPGSVGGVSFEDEDVLGWDSTTDAWFMALDGSAIGLPASADVNGVHISGADDLATATVFMSFQSPTVVPTLGLVDDSDVVGYEIGTGQFFSVLDGSAVGLTTSSEDIDALFIDNGDLVVSTVGGASVPGVGGSTVVSRDEDLLKLSQAGEFELLFDGSDVGLSREDVSGASIDEATQELFLATLGVFNVPGLSGDKDDVPVFTGTTGAATSGTFEPFFNGDDHGFGTEQVDGVHIFALSPPPPGTADLSITKVDDVDPAQIGDVVTYTVEVTNNSATDASENVVVVDTLPAGTSLVATAGCAQDPNGLPCSLGTIAPGSSKSYTVAVSIDSSPPGLITNTAVVSSGTADPVPGNNTASEDTEIVVAPTAVDDGPASNSVPGDDFHTPASTVIDSPSLVANDDLGDPAAMISSFGGGDLGGFVTDNAPGSTVAAAGGTLSVDANGDFSLDPGPGFDGLFSFQYRLTAPGGISDATVSIFVGDRPATTSRDMIWVSSSTAGTTGGVAYNDEDIIVFDAAAGTWSMVFDGSDVGLTATDINALHIVDPNDPLSPILMSFQAPISLSGLGTVDDADVVEFTPILLGTTTAGSFNKVFDGSDNALGSSAEDIDAISLDDSGALLLSTIGGNRVPAAGGGDLVGRDEDLLRFDANLATYTLHFDGSDVDLAAEDLVGASVDPVNGRLYGAALNGFIVPAVSGDNNDVFSFSGAFGDTTAGTYNTFFDGQDLNLSSEQIDGLHVVDLPDNTAPTANPDRAATDENTPITIGPDYSTSISSEGGEIDKIAADPRTGNYVVLDEVSSLVRVRVYDPVNRRVLHTTSIASLGPAAAFPGGVDVDLRTGNIVVAEFRSSTVTVFDPTLSTVLDSETVTGLGFVRAVTVDPFTGNIIVGGQDLSRIYTPGFASSTDVEHNGLVATGFDVDERNGEIVAVLFEDRGSSGPGQIQRWESDGDFIQTITTGDMDFPWDLSIDQPTGDIAVPNRSANNSGVVAFDENGNTKSIIGGFSEPGGVAYDPMTGLLAVADGGGSLVNPTTGALLDSFLDRRDHTMAVQPVSEEILANSGSSRLNRLVTLDPTTRTRLGLDERFVVDVATDPTTGRIAVIIGEAIAPRVLEIYDPTGSTLLHSTSVPGASVAFHPDTGEVAVSLRTGEFRLYDPTLTTVLTSFPFARTDSLGVQPGTGNIVTRSGGSEVRILDDGGSQIGSIMPSPLVSDFAVDPATGNIAVAVLLANAETEVWDPTGTTILDSIPAPSVGGSAVGVAYGGTGNLIIGYDNHGPLDVMARGVLANDTDPDGDPLTVTGFDATSANGAAVTVNPDGSFTYDPTGVPAIEALGAGETLADTFTYTIGDGNGETDTATATVFVAGVNAAPVLGGPAAITVAENTAAVADFNATDDTNSEGSGLTYSFIGEVDGERLSINTSTGALQFNPPADFENPDDANQDNVYEIVVGVTDSDGLSDALNVTVTVTDVVETGSITIIQDTVPDWATDFSFTGGLGAFSLDDDAAAPSNSGDNTLSNTFEATLLEPGVYTVTQSAVSPFVVTSLDCTGGSTSTDTGTRTATITLAAGDAVTCTFTTEPSSDVSVILSDSPDPIVAGQTLDYLFGFSTTFPISNPVLTLDLPAGVTYVGALNGFDSFCSETAPGFVTCDGFNGLWNGATFRIEVMVDAGTVGSISATGSVSFTGAFDPNLANNTATVGTTVTAPDLPPTLVSSTPSEGGTIEPGDDLQLTFSEPVTLVETAGPAMFLNCDVAGSISLAVTGGPTEFTVSPSPSLTPGANCTLSLEASRVLDQDGTPDQLAGDGNFDFQVAPGADLSITKTDSADPVTAGGSLTYTIEVTNAGPQDATNVVVTDTLPAGVTLVSTSGCAEDPNGVPTCTLGAIASGGSKSYTVTVTVDSGTTGTITNSVSVAADENDPNAANNSASADTTVNAPMLSVIKVDELLIDNDTDNAADPGDTLRYTVTITNELPNSLNNMVFNDTIDSDTTLVGAVHVSPLAVADGYNSTETGLSISAALGVLLNDADPDGMVSNSVVAVNGLSGDVGNPTASSEGGSVTVAANGGFDYTPPGGFDGDDTFTYTLSDGDPLTRDDTETVTITVAQTANALQIPEFSIGQGLVTASTTLTQSLGLVESGQVIEIVFDVMINTPGPASAEVCNQATVTSGNASPVSSDDPDTATADDPTCTAVELPPAVPGSAAIDAYDSIGNVGISVPVVGGLLDNDTDGSVGANSVGAVQGSPSNVGSGVATDQGGSVNVATTGSFIYTPPAGFEGADTFTYTIDDGIAGANPNETATVTITVDEVIWFIDGNQQVQGSGTQNSPFNSIGGTGFATAADEAGDIIYLTDDSSAYAGPFNLKADQVLLGEGSTLSIPAAAGITLPTYSFILPAPIGTVTTRPEIQAASGTTITLASGNVVRGLNISSTAGSRIAGTNVGDAVLADLTVGIGGSEGIDIDFNGANSGSLLIDNTQMSGNTTAAGTPVAIDIDQAGSGTVDVTITNSSVMVGTAATRSVELTAADSSVLTYDISNNTVNQTNSVAILVLAEDNSGVSGQITTNIVTSAAGSIGGAIQVEATDTSQHTSRVDGNTVTLGSDSGGGVRAVADTPTVGSSARVDATINNNVINIGQNVAFGRGIQLHASRNTVCANVTNNTVNDNSTNVDIGMSVVQENSGVLFLQDLAAPVNGGAAGTPGLLDALWTSKGNSTNADAGATFLQGVASPGNCLLPAIP